MIRRDPRGEPPRTLQSRRCLILSPQPAQYSRRAYTSNADRLVSSRRSTDLGRQRLDPLAPVFDGHLVVVRGRRAIDVDREIEEPLLPRLGGQSPRPLGGAAVAVVDVDALAAGLVDPVDPPWDVFVL